MASTEAKTETGHTTAAAHTEAAGGEHGGGAFPPLDAATFPSQLFWLVIFFAALYVLLARMVLPRFATIIGDRKAQVDGDIARAQALKDETQAALAAYEKRLTDARGNAGDIAKQTRDAAQAHAAAQQAKLDADLGAKIKTAEDQIAASKAKAMASVHDIAADTAADIVAQLTGATTLKAAAAKAVAAVKN